MIIDEDTNRDNNSIMKYDRRDTYFGSTALYTSSLVKMSFDSHTIIDEDTNRDNNSIMKYDRRDTYFGSTVLYTSSVVINFHQLKTDLYAQHHHEKDALDQLNQRFHRFVDRIQLLQSQNSKYIAAIADLKREFSGSSSIDVQSDEHYLSIKSNLLTLNIGKVDYEFDLEMFQLQIQIYQHLIETEKQGKNQRILKLEEELKQSASVLITLRTSYAELQRQVENHNVENEDLLKEYLKLTHHLCDVKKQRQKSDLNVETWKSYIEFYKNLRSHTER
jgi:chromosome segregation ATPase